MNCGSDPKSFNLDGYWKYEESKRGLPIDETGSTLPIFMSKLDYLKIGGWDENYELGMVADWDFFLKLDLNGLSFIRTHEAHLYHFGSTATKNGKEGVKFKASEQPAADLFMYKWGIRASIFDNLSHNPKNGQIIKGIKYE